MKVKEYLKELSLTILGVLIALIIDNYREELRDNKIVRSYLEIVNEDLQFDIRILKEQVKQDSGYAQQLGYLSSVLATNRDLPSMKFGLSMWQKQDSPPYRKLNEWDSLDYYAMNLYANTEYNTRKIGFSTIVNSNLSHQIENDLLKKITIYYTTDSDRLDFVTDIDDRCHWLGIEYLNKYQGSLKKRILTTDFDATQLRNEVSGRYNTTLTEMHAKQEMIEKARELLKGIQSY